MCVRLTNAGGFEQHRPAEQSGGEKSPCGAFLDARLAISTRAHQKTSTYESTLRFLFCSKARLTGRADSNSCGDVAEDGAKTVRCNSDDRCQRQMQGGAVGAAASGMCVPPKARRSRWEPRPGFLFIPRGSRYPPGQTLFHSPLKNAQTKTTVRVDGGSVIEKNRRGAGRVSGQAPAGSWQNPPV